MISLTSTETVTYFKPFSTFFTQIWTIAWKRFNRFNWQFDSLFLEIHINIPSQPLHDLSHSKHVKDPSLFTQNLLLGQAGVVFSEHSSISTQPRVSCLCQPVLQLLQFFGPGPEQPPSAQATWHIEQSNLVSSLNAS